MTEKKYGSGLSIDERVKLFKEWLENGGIDTINSIEVLEDLKEVRFDQNGKVIRETISPLVNAMMLAYEGSQVTPPMSEKEFFSEYNTTLQKSLFFDQENIDTPERFDELFSELISKKDTLFRGACEARWRLYSSLQRYWITEKLYEKEISYQAFLENLVSNARIEQKETISKYLYLNRIDPNNDIAVMSFLQHYGCPTPLLDWTYSFLNSLYFAIDGIKKAEGTREIDQYFSVYHIEEKFFKSSSLRDIIEEGLKREHSRLEKMVIERSLEEGVEEEQIGKIFSPERLQIMAKMYYGKGLITHLTKIEHLIKMPISYFSDFDEDNDLQFSLNNNLNIVNQKGAFTWNADSSKPLEQMGNEITMEESGSAYGYRFCSCYNINKELENHVRGRLEEHGIVKNYIYPDPNEIAWNCFSNTLQMIT